MNAAPPSADPIPETALWQRAKAIKAAWQEGAAPPAADAAAAVEPALAADPKVLLDLAYEEYRLRREAGEEVDVEAFAAQFPSVRSRVRQQLLADRGFSIPGGPLESVCKELGATKLEQPERWPEAGERLGDFTLVRPLGAGAVARVFLAKEASTGDRPVVLKLSFSKYGDPEAQTLGRLAHPNVVPIWSCHRDAEAGLTITCMPFLGSATLEDVLKQVHGEPGRPPRQASRLLQAIRARRRPDDPPVPEGQPEPLLRHGSFAAGVLLLGAYLAEALAFLHARGVYHSDLKPSNVLLGPDGCPRLLDFNLAIRSDAVGALEGGTPDYAAPEHLRYMMKEPDAPPPDGRSDVFALGVVLSELLTGRHPFGGLPKGLSARQQGEMLLGRQQAGCPLPAARGLPPAAARLLGRCLSFDPAKRPTAADLAAGLHNALGPGRLRRWTTRHRRSLVALACLLPLVLGAAFTALRPDPHKAGIRAYNEGRYADAVEHFTRASEAKPGDVKSRLYRGLALLKASRSNTGEVDGGAIGAAMWDFKEVLDREPSALCRAGLAYCTSCEQHHKQALEATEEDAKTGSATTAVLNNRACAFLQLMGYLDAGERALAAIDPQDRELPEVCYNRALLAYKRRCQRKQPVAVPAEALEDIRGFLTRAEPVPWEPYRDAAQLYACAAEDNGVLPDLREQRKERAIGYLRSALEHGMSPTFLDMEADWRDLHGRDDFAVLRFIQRPLLKPSPLAWLALRLINPAPEKLE
jgi:serine/threonine protein kinase